MSHGIHAICILTSLLLFTGSPAWSSEPALSSRAEPQQLPVSIPNGWKYHRNLFGFPFVLLGPKEGPNRSTFSITPAASVTSALFKSEGLGGSQHEYKEARAAWLKKVGGKALQHFPYKKWSSGKFSAHSIGYRYRLNGSEFEERSHFIVCQGATFHLKSLVPSDRWHQDIATAEAITNSFNCSL